MTKILIDKETVKLALNFFERTSNCLPTRYDQDGLAVHTTLRQALEQSTEQEPVALRVVGGELCYKSREDDQSFGMWCPVTPDFNYFPEGTEFYTQPQEAARQPLSREVIERDFHGRVDFVRQVEAAHGITGEHK